MDEWTIGPFVIKDPPTFGAAALVVALVALAQSSETAAMNPALQFVLLVAFLVAACGAALRLRTGKRLAEVLDKDEGKPGRHFLVRHAMKFEGAAAALAVITGLANVILFGGVFLTNVLGILCAASVALTTAMMAARFRGRSFFSWLGYE